MEVRVLGPLEVVDGERVAPLGGARQRGVLALLVMHAGRSLSADRIIDELWAGDPPPSAVTTLRGYLSHLRRALEPDRPAGAPGAVLVGDGAGYRLAVEPGQVDAGRFEALVARAGAALDGGRAAAALDLVDDALALWRGPAFADFAFEPFARAEIARLDALRAAAEDLRVDARLALGRHAEVVGELEARVAASPLRERAWAQLMTALYRDGRQADALRAFQRARTTLLDDLGLEPGPELRALEAAVLAHDPALEAPPTVAPPPPGNLPHLPSRFVGRERELAEVAALVAANRLVTLTGPGGSGKTRLALEVAAAARPGWVDGVWLVELAAVSDPGLVAAAVAGALGVAEEPGVALAATLARTLGSRRLLLVADNCEQVAGACARLARDLLAAGPGLHVLATSRRVLGVAGEVAWAVPPLGTDPPSGEDEWWACDAGRLLADRAAAASPGFAPAAADAAAALAICRRLDGLPLAIELAAARLRTLTVGQVADRLQDRFALLTTGDPTAAPRQRTLRAAVEWSHDLLGPAERAVFARLAVFAGAFPLEAAEAVAGGAGVEAAEVLDVVARLVDRSLVARRPDVDGTARFRLLDTLRAFGAERLAASGEAPAARRRHLAWHLALAEAEAGRMRGPTQVAALERVDASEDDLRAALGAAVDGGGPAALRLAAALWWYWVRRGRLSEGREWLRRALEGGAGAPAGLRATALAAAAYLAWVQDDLAEAGPLAAAAREAAGEAGDAAARALAAAVAGRVALSAGDPDAAAAADDDALAAYRRLGDRWGEAWVLRHLAGVAMSRGDPDEATSLAGASRGLFAALDDGWGVAGTVDLLATIALDRGDLEAACALGEESVRSYRRLGDRAGLAVALYHLAVARRERGEVEPAARLAAESAALDRQLGGRASLAAASALVDEMAAVADEAGSLP
ncbi:MAG: BTAD domain-containing putative transcriptional regulator [Acidimicrobiia bacterium]